MPSSYPGALDAIPNPTSATLMNASGFEHDVLHSAVADAVEAVQTELGTDPSGAAATVKARLDANDTAVAAKITYPAGGATSDVLTKTGASSAAWATPAAGGSPGLVCLAVATPATATAVNFTSYLSAAYDTYMVTIDVTMSNAAQELWFRARSGSTDLATGTPYKYAAMYANDSTATGGYQGPGAVNQVRIGFTATAGERLMKTMTLMGPFLTHKTGLICDGYDETTNMRVAAVITNSTSYDGFTILPQAGTITGTIRLYGYRNTV